MRPLLLALLFVLVLTAQEQKAVPAQGQPPAGAEAHGTATAGAHEGSDPLLPYKWLNFAVLFGGLAFLAIKFGGPFFRARSKAILDDLNIAVRRSEEAAAKAAEIEKRMETLPVEIEKLRASAKIQFEAESAKIQAETTELLAKVEASAQQEISAAGEEASKELRTFAADLALKLAEQKISERIGPRDQTALVKRFVESITVAERKS